MIYVNQLAGLDTYRGVNLPEFTPPPSADIQYTYPLQPIQVSSSNVYHSLYSEQQPEENDWPKVITAFGKLALAVTVAVVTTIGIINRVDAAPADPYLEQQQQFYQQNPGMDPARLDPSVVRVNPYQFNR